MKFVLLFFALSNGVPAESTKYLDMPSYRECRMALDAIKGINQTRNASDAIIGFCERK